MAGGASVTASVRSEVRARQAGVRSEVEQKALQKLQKATGTDGGSAHRTNLHGLLGSVVQLAVDGLREDSPSFQYTRGGMFRRRGHGGRGGRQAVASKGNTALAPPAPPPPPSVLQLGVLFGWRVGRSPSISSTAMSSSSGLACSSTPASAILLERGKIGSYLVLVTVLYRCAVSLFTN